jgi:hypothetical protein
MGPTKYQGKIWTKPPTAANLLEFTAFYYWPKWYAKSTISTQAIWQLHAIMNLQAKKLSNDITHQNLPTIILICSTRFINFPTTSITTEVRHAKAHQRKKYGFGKALDKWAI